MQFARFASVGLPRHSVNTFGIARNFNIATSFSRPSLKSTPTSKLWLRPFTFRALAGVGLGLSVAIATSPVVFCDSRPGSPPPTYESTASPSPSSTPPSDPPKSILNVYELTFGSVCGICAGVFVKKGVKLAAFLLGGIFVVLQYLGHMSVIRVDWGQLSSRFENLCYTKDEKGVRKPPTVGSLFTWFVDFLTANFQERATFVAGFVLGLRIG